MRPSTAPIPRSRSAVAMLRLIYRRMKTPAKPRPSLQVSRHGADRSAGAAASRQPATTIDIQLQRPVIDLGQIRTPEACRQEPRPYHFMQSHHSASARRSIRLNLVLRTVSERAVADRSRLCRERLLGSYAAGNSRGAWLRAGRPRQQGGQPAARFGH